MTMTEHSPTEVRGSFEDLQMASRFRDFIRVTVESQINKQRPALRKGVVASIDPEALEVGVSFDGADPITVKVGAVQPTVVGQTVHVEGQINDLWVTNVVGPTSLTEIPIEDLTIPDNIVITPFIGGLSLTWENENWAPRYEVEYSTDPSFVSSKNIISQTTSASIPGITPEVTWHVRIRAAQSGDGRGEWSETSTGVPIQYPDTTHDGDAPSESPEPDCTPMLGAVFASWTPVDNPDLTYYDVYASLSSGFTVGPTNKVGSTVSSFFIVRTFTDGTPVPLGVNVFVRIVARDKDGSAPVGAQGFAAPAYVNTPDVGTIDTGAIGDGLAPTASPNAPLVNSGPGYLYVVWDHITNPDPVTYEVHVSDSSAAFLPTTNTLVGETPSNWFFVRTQGPGESRAGLVYGDDYWIRLVAKDTDGVADPGTAGTGFTTPIGTVDIAEGTITAESGILANAAIGTAHIQEAAITSAQIAELAVSTAHIQDAAIGSAQIGNLQVTNAHIQDLAVNKLIAGSLAVGEYISSANYDEDELTGWIIDSDGDVIFNDGIFRGDIFGATITSSDIRTGTWGQQVRLVPGGSLMGGIEFWNDAAPYATISPTSFGQVVCIGTFNFSSLIASGLSVSGGATFGSTVSITGMVTLSAFLQSTNSIYAATGLSTNGTVSGPHGSFGSSLTILGFTGFWGPNGSGGTGRRAWCINN